MCYPVLQLEPTDQKQLPDRLIYSYVTVCTTKITHIHCSSIQFVIKMTFNLSSENIFACILFTIIFHFMQKKSLKMV